MRISIVVAMSKNRVIGKAHGLPWRLPDDLKHLRRTTMGKPIVMGRRTFESIGCRPLDGRTNIILSETIKLEPDGCRLARSAEEALKMAGSAPEVMILGGSAVYSAYLAQTDRIYLTLVHTEVDGDTFFPEISLSSWSTVEQVDHDSDGKHAYPFSFMTLDRPVSVRPNKESGA